MLTIFQKLNDNMTPQDKNGKFIEAGFIKYPTNRDLPMFEKSPYKWLEGKRIDDALPDDLEGPYWRIGDKLYNLTEFIDKHPGGN